MGRRQAGKWEIRKAFRDKGVAQQRGVPVGMYRWGKCLVWVTKEKL